MGSLPKGVDRKQQTDAKQCARIAEQRWKDLRKQGWQPVDPAWGAGIELAIKTQQSE